MQRNPKACQGRRSSIIIILICIIVALAAIPVHAADLSLEKSMQKNLLESSRLIASISEKQAAGVSSIEEVATTFVPFDAFQSELKPEQTPFVVGIGRIQRR